MAQSYVGKCPVSKGIGTVIRRFVVPPFTPDFPNRQRRASAQFDGRPLAPPLTWAAKRPYWCDRSTAGSDDADEAEHA
jgi:hypothetical protein